MFCRGPLPGSPCPWLLQCQPSLAQGKQLCASFTSLSHAPAPPAAAPGVLLQGPGTWAVTEPQGAAHPWQCTAHTGAPGWECAGGFCHSKRDSTTQKSSYCKAKAEPEQCHTPAETGILRIFLNIPPSCKTSVFIQC